MIKKINVTSREAFEYLANQLNMGKNLCALIKKLPLKKGNVFAVVPTGTTGDLLYKFTSGGIYPSDKNSLHNMSGLVKTRNDSQAFLVNGIHEYLKSNEMNCCLFEEPNSEPTDLFVQKSGLEYVTLSHEMFYFLNSSTNDATKISQVIKKSEAYYFLCALGIMDINNHNNFYAHQGITLEMLYRFTKNINSFFVRAYDGEGYLKWERA